MRDWKEILDGMAAGEAVVPSHVRILRLPRIDGWEPGRVWCTWKVDPELIQPHGALFGGYIAAVADEMVGLATGSVLTGGKTFVTSESSIHYFRPVRGGELRIEGSVVHQGGSSVHAEVTFTDDSGALVAKASATQNIRRPRE
jgi:uncharacterized protein (TIGR00369 family)